MAATVTCRTLVSRALRRKVPLTPIGRQTPKRAYIKLNAALVHSAIAIHSISEPSVTTARHATWSAGSDVNAVQCLAV